jgi:hypothetical protein
MLINFFSKFARARILLSERRTRNSSDPAFLKM